MIILVALSLMALISAQPVPRCDLKADMAILLDPTVDAETFQTIKKTALAAALSLNLTESRVGVWQMTLPPKQELAPSVVTEELLIRTMTVIKQEKTKYLYKTDARSLIVAKRALAKLSPLHPGQRIRKTILYVAKSSGGHDVLEAADLARARGCLIRAIAVGMRQHDTEDLYAMTGGGTSNVLVLSQFVNQTHRYVQNWMCSGKLQFESVGDVFCPDSLACLSPGESGKFTVPPWKRFPGRISRETNRKQFVTFRDLQNAKKLAARLENSDDIEGQDDTVVDVIPWDDDLFEGDIDLGGQGLVNLVDTINSLPVDQDFEPRGNAVAEKHRLWPLGNIPYILSSKFNDEQRAVIALAMEEIQQFTCVRWLARRGRERDYITITLGSISKPTCRSSIGRMFGKQELILSAPCITKGIVMHEMIHAIGFLHEQSRSDRDQYVDIQWHRLPRGKGSKNFQTYGVDKIDNLKTNYDYSSLMHYPRSFDGIEIIVPLIDVPVGQRKKMSEKDIFIINKLYECVREDELKPVCDPSNDCARRAQNGQCLTDSKRMLMECLKFCMMCHKPPKVLPATTTAAPERITPGNVIQTTPIAHATSASPQDCPPGWITVPDACYKYVGVRDFPDAEAACQNEHQIAHLPVFRNAQDLARFKQKVIPALEHKNLYIFLAGITGKSITSDGSWILPDFRTKQESGNEDSENKPEVGRGQQIVQQKAAYQYPTNGAQQVQNYGRYRRSVNAERTSCEARFLNWNLGEPNNAGGRENCLVLLPESLKYNDVPCDVTEQSLVCQIPSFHICDDSNIANDFAGSGIILEGATTNFISCNFTRLPTLTTYQFFAVINDQQYKGGAACGSCMELANSALQTVVVYVVDHCPTCEPGTFVLPKPVYELLLFGALPTNQVGGSLGKNKIQYRPVSCPANYVQNAIKIYTNPGSNPWWAAFQPRNMRNPIARMSLRRRVDVKGEPTNTFSDWKQLPRCCGGGYFVYTDAPALLSVFQIKLASVDVETTEVKEIIVDMQKIIPKSVVDTGMQN